MSQITFDYILKRLKEKTTWVGLLTVAGIVISWFGLTLDEQTKLEITTVGLSVVGLLNIFLHEKTSE